MKKNLQKKCFTTILLTFIEFSLIKKLSFRLTYARPPAAKKVLKFFFFREMIFFFVIYHPH